MRTLRPVGVWWVRSAQPDVVTVHGFAGYEHPDGAVVDVRELPPGRGATGTRVARVAMRADNRQLLSVEVLGEPAGAAPALVFAERIDREASPVTADLVAFLHDDAVARAEDPALAAVAPGTVLTARDLHRLGLTANDQVAAVRWYPETGQAREVYVDPAYRRRRIATTLFFGAEACAVARGWPRLWGDGVRTAMGEAMLRVFPWGLRRVAPLTHVAPPMTPPDEEAGRLLGRD